jgi:truncated hemoglobin YjbI
MWFLTKIFIFRKQERSFLPPGVDAEVIDAVVDFLYRKAIEDKHVNRFFEDIDLDRLRHRQKVFLMMALSGPPDDSTKARMRNSHAHLLKWELDDSHFDRILEHVAEGLRACQVDEEVIAAAAHNLEGFRDDVLGR